MAKDWRFRVDHNICSVRVAGVLLRDGKLLVQREADGDEYALPGGHLQVGEDSKASLIRKFREELGVEIRPQRLLWLEENLWSWQGCESHSMGFYYQITAEDENLPQDGELRPRPDNPKVLLGWLPVEQLGEVSLYPHFLRERLQDLKPYPEHIIVYD